MSKRYTQTSNLAQVLNIIGDRWTLLILYTTWNGHKTFASISKELVNIAPNLLSQRLKFLDEQNLIVKTEYCLTPSRSYYELTEAGERLGDTFRSLVIWGDEFLNSPSETLRHVEGKHTGIVRHFLCLR